MSVSVIASTAEFDEKTSKGLVLVDFFAPWCGPCRMQLPILELVAEKAGESAIVCKVNTDEMGEIASKYDVSSIPTLVLLKDGNVVERFVGLQQEDVLLAAIKQAS